MTYTFGPYTLDPAAYRLLRGSEVVQLSPKIIDLLLHLVARQPALVSKDDLFKALWPDVAVTDNALTQAVSELRQALGDDPSKPVYVQTVARRGYRFIAPVTATAPAAAVVATAPVPAQNGESFERLAQQPAIAVLDFANVSGDRELAWLSSGIAETVTNDLRATSPLRVVDRMRVVEAARRGGPDLSALRAELHLDLAVVGSFQRSGTRLRITARVVDAASGEATAEAKADGPLEQVFELQDRIVSQFAEALRIGTKQPRSLGDTSSLEAYRAFTEGRVRSGVARCLRGPGRDRRLRASDRAGPAVRGGARRPGERAVLAVPRCPARATSRRGGCWRGRSTTSGARSSSNATWPTRTPRSRSF